MSGANRLAASPGAIFFVAVTLLAGCAGRTTIESQTTAGAEAIVTAEKLAGTEWLLEDLGGAGIVYNSQATLSFPKSFASEGRISGNGSCNKFSGSASVNAGSIKVGPLAATRMACAPAVDFQETNYLRALQSAERVTLDGPYLYLYAKGVEKPLRFIKK